MVNLTMDNLGQWLAGGALAPGSDELQPVRVRVGRPGIPRRAAFSIACPSERLPLNLATEALRAGAGFRVG